MNLKRLGNTVVTDEQKWTLLRFRLCFSSAAYLTSQLIKKYSNHKLYNFLITFALLYKEAFWSILFFQIEAWKLIHRRRLGSGSQTFPVRRVADHLEFLVLLEAQNIDLYTGGPRYSRTFYLRIRLFTSTKRVQNNNFPVKIGLFICEFKICGPKWRSLSTANNEGNLYRSADHLSYLADYQWSAEQTLGISALRYKLIISMKFYQNLI